MTSSHVHLFRSRAKMIFMGVTPMVPSSSLFLRIFHLCDQNGLSTAGFFSQIFFRFVAARIVIFQLSQKIPSEFLSWEASALADARKLDKQRVLPKKELGSLTNLMLSTNPPPSSLTSSTNKLD
jgi:hypothetical protein